MHAFKNFSIPYIPLCPHLVSFPFLRQLIGYFFLLIFFPFPLFFHWRRSVVGWFGEGGGENPVAQLQKWAPSFGAGNGEEARSDAVHVTFQCADGSKNIQVLTPYIVCTFMATFIFCLCNFQPPVHGSKSKWPSGFKLSLVPYAYPALIYQYDFYYNNDNSACTMTFSVPCLAGRLSFQLP